MTLSKDNLMIASKGYLLTGEPGIAHRPSVQELEAFAADTTNLPGGLEILGYTSRENLIAMSKDGGDSTVLGAWEAEQLETFVAERAVDYLDAQALEFKNSVLELYYGGGDYSQPGYFEVPENAVSPHKSLCIVYLTRGQVRGQFFPETAVSGEDAMEHATDNWSTIPLRFTVLDPDVGARQTWIGRNVGAPVVDGPSAMQAPVITGVSPSTLDEAGGETVTITGTSFTGTTSVTFEGVEAASFTVNSATQITAVSPAFVSGGAVDIVVTTPHGSGTDSSATAA